jgi:hypothetical protein
VAGSTKGIIHTATPPPPPALLGVWRLSQLSQHGVHACWFPGSLSPRHHKKEKGLPCTKTPPTHVRYVYLAAKAMSVLRWKTTLS